LVTAERGVNAMSAFALPDQHPSAGDCSRRTDVTDGDQRSAHHLTKETP
jgi:hypothetical protein